LDQLVASLQLVGPLQPISVRQTGTGYRLIFGRRRFMAAEKLGWSAIEAKVFTNAADDVEAMLVNAAENLHRQSHSSAENLALIQFLKEKNISTDGIAQCLCTSKAWVESHLEIIKNTELRAIANLGFLKDAEDVKTFKASPSHIRSLFLTN
jgi:ParB family chromosome partitioning protein